MRNELQNWEKIARYIYEYYGNYELHGCNFEEHENYGYDYYEMADTIITMVKEKDNE